MTFHFKMFYVMVIGFFTFCNCQRLIYNTTYCKNYRDIINIRNFPKYPPYAMSLSSSTYQAGQPITIEVLGCKSNGFRAFMLRAEIQGYVYRNPLDTDRTELGQIMISCGTGNYQNGDWRYRNNNDGNWRYRDRDDNGNDDNWRHRNNGDNDDNDSNWRYRNNDDNDDDDDNNRRYCNNGDNNNNNCRYRNNNFNNNNDDWRYRNNGRNTNRNNWRYRNKNADDNDDNRSLNVLKFRWIPPLRSAGNITFHFTAVPKIPSSYWLKFATQELQRGEESYITVQQDCSASSFIKAPLMLLSTALFLTQFIL